MNRLWLLFPLLLIGCGTTTRSYDITVKNDTAKDLIVWLAKDGEPYEPTWASPEDIAIEKPGGGDAYWGIHVPPGKTAYTGEIHGKFFDQTTAILRVYTDVQTVHDLLATSRGSLTRLDLELTPGINRFIVEDPLGRLSARRE